MAKKKKTTKRGKQGWPPHLKQRVQRLRDQIKQEELDGFLVTNPLDIRYLTGFEGENAWLLVTPRTAVVISDRRFEQELAERFSFVRSIMRKRPLAEELKDLAEHYAIEALGIQAEAVTVDERRSIAKQIGASTLKNTTGWLAHFRETKDEHEVRAIRGAVRIQQRAFDDFRAYAQPGMSERELCAYLEYCLKCHGAEGTSFPTIVAANANSAMPHHQPGATRWKKRQPLLIDFGAVHEGYCSDMTRVLTTGSLSPQLQAMYQIVREAQQAGVAAVAPGVTCEEVDHAARSVIEEAGYAKRFSHGLGHGIGLQVHEAPRLGKGRKESLEPGHVVTIEPGIYIAGAGGIRLEDDVLVTDIGRRNLCSLTTRLDDMSI